jgi:hypothetical protein
MMDNQNLLSGLEEDDAFTLLRQIENQFGWSVTVVTRADAEAILDRDLTDDQWNTLRFSPVWGKVLPETMFAAANDVLNDLIDRVLPDSPEGD